MVVPPLTCPTVSSGVDLSSDELTNLVAKRFISRRDVKAIQHPDGKWSPHTVSGKRDGERIPWSRADLIAHIEGRTTFGHYMLDTDDTCKLFAFDVDLTDKGFLPTLPMLSEVVDDRGVDEEGANLHLKEWEASFVECNPRECWLDRRHPARTYMKFQLRLLAAKLVAGVHSELDIPCAAAYSGGKGIHVYGFTGKIPAADAREGAKIVLDALGCFEAFRGENFFKHVDQSIPNGFPNFTIEVFPKQNSLEGKDLGNLMRLALGRNQKSSDPTFFMDMTSALTEMVPLDPVYALTTDNPWKRPGE